MRHIFVPPLLKGLLAAMVLIGQANAASCSSADGTSSCSCAAGQRCVTTQSQCWCETANQKDDPPEILANASLSFDSCTKERVPVVTNTTKPSAD